MKREEKIAEQFLRTLEMGDPVFEPDGNIPPDFSLADGRIGVEVRRLNHVNIVNGKPQGADELSSSLWPSFEKLLTEFDPQYAGETFWISVFHKHTFRRLTKSMKKTLRSHLQAFLDEPKNLPYEMWVTDSILFRIQKIIPVEGRVFQLASTANLDEGGFLIPKYITNISYCIVEKSEKIAPYYQRYSEWRLVLIDYLGWGRADRTKTEAVLTGIQDLGLFSRLYVLDVHANIIMEKNSST